MVDGSGYIPHPTGHLNGTLHKGLITERSVKPVKWGMYRQDKMPHKYVSRSRINIHSWQEGEEETEQRGLEISPICNTRESLETAGGLGMCDFLWAEGRRHMQA